MSTPQETEQATIVVYMTITPSKAVELDNYRSTLRPMPSRASVLRAALAEYLKRQEEGRHPAVPAPTVPKSWR